MLLAWICHTEPQVTETGVKLSEPDILEWTYTHPGITFSINKPRYDELVFLKAEEYPCYGQGFDLTNSDHAPRMREDMTLDTAERLTS